MAWGTTNARQPAAGPETAPVQFRLFVSHGGRRTDTMLEHLRSILDETMEGGYTIEVVNVREAPQEAERASVLATPTLVAVASTPRNRIIGDLYGSDKLVAWVEAVWRDHRSGGDAHGGR